MPKPGRLLFSALIALAGCSTAPRVREPGALDWNSTGTNPAPPRVEVVAEPPKLAPPPSNAPSATPPSPRPPAASYAETWIPLGRWAREHNVGSLRRTATAPSPTFALTTSNGVLTVQVNSLAAKWNGLELRLGFEPQLVDEQPFVHVLDLKKNIEPLLRDFPLPEKAGRIVVIDPGHGGSNTGTASVLDGASEKQYTLDWAKRLEALLANRGWLVFLTRTEDADVSLADRVAFAGQRGADLFISLHFNSAAPNREQSGLETFCLTPAGMPSTLTREFDDNPALVFTNNACDAENLQFALRLHRALLQAGGMTDRGVRRARFMVVLRGQSCPAVLIEGGYLSNPREARRIADPAYRQLLAEAVAGALEPDDSNRRSVVKAQKPESDVPGPAIRTPTSELQSSNSPATNTPLQ